YAPSGWWEFTVNVEKGILGSMIEKPLQPYNSPGDPHYYPEFIPEADAIRAGRIAAKLLTAGEDYYNGAITRLPPDGVDLSGLTFSDGWYNSVNLEGLDSGEMYWYSPDSSHYPQGQLFFNKPAFLGPAFEGVNGYAAWADEGHTSVQVSMGTKWPYREFTVDLAGGNITHGVIDSGLSDRDLLLAAQTFACLMTGAEDYKLSNSYRPAQEGSLPLDRPMELVFASGAGAWQTNLLLYPDGSFVGDYCDADMNIHYVCQFHGQFKDIRQVTAASWSMVLEELVLDTGRPIGEEWNEGGIHYISSDPYGFDGLGGGPLEPGAQFMFYTPDAKGYAPGDELYGMSGDDDDSPLYGFWGWWPDKSVFTPNSTLGCYGLRSVETGCGFFDLDAWGIG
ncbi:MAG: hypothetical protein K2K53_05230, partial [Oscillospiraceae bacterium]|nr:hypothetical protein [Oscillospiraceae bacterium]